MTAVLNLGAGNKPLAGACNHDRIKHRDEIDVVHDLNELPWPWGDESFDLIFATGVLEHLNLTIIEALDECWRILRSGGMLRVKVPFWQHDNAYTDPTHRWQCSLRTFDYVNPATKLGREYGFYTERKWKFDKPPILNKERSSVLANLLVRKEAAE